MEPDYSEHKHAAISPLPVAGPERTSINIYLRNSPFKLSHFVVGKSELSYVSGNEAFKWQIEFCDDQQVILVNGESKPVQPKEQNRIKIGYLPEVIKPGETTEAKTD